MAGTLGIAAARAQNAAAVQECQQSTDKGYCLQLLQQLAIRRVEVVELVSQVSHISAADTDAFIQKCEDEQKKIGALAREFAALFTDPKTRFQFMLAAQKNDNMVVMLERVRHEPAEDQLADLMQLLHQSH
ncbi:MAG TPA: hypothetical protein VGJ20_36885 [Xanthobacteraceae bacterium]